MCVWLGDGGEEPALRRARHQMACVMSGALRAPPASTWAPRPAPPPAVGEAAAAGQTQEERRAEVLAAARRALDEMADLVARHLNSCLEEAAGQTPAMRRQQRVDALAEANQVQGDFFPPLAPDWTGSTPGWLPMLHLWHRKGLDHAGVPLGGRAGNLAHGSPAAYTEQQAP